MPSNTRIRPFLRSDQKAARDLILEGLGEHFGFIDETLNPDLDDIASSYPQQGHEFLIATEDGSIVGTAALLLESSNKARVVRMSVSKHRRRAGIAQKLMEHLVCRAQALGFRELWAHTEPHWEDAVGFYRSFGFEQCGSDAVDIHLKLGLYSNKGQVNNRKK